MHRGNCGVVLAGFCWLVLAAASTNNGIAPKGNDATEQDQPASKPEGADKAVLAATNNAVEAGEQDLACQDRRDNHQSELCAQWQAADATERAANFAGWSLLIGTIGTALLVWTLWDTRRTSRAQLRAYLSIEPKGILEATPKERCKIASCITNHGQTPAYDLHVAAALAIDDPRTFEPNALEVRDQDRAEISLGPSHSMHIYGYLAPLTKPQETKIRDRELAIITYGTVHYTDAFGTAQYVKFSYYFWGEELSADAALRTKKWNDAS